MNTNINDVYALPDGTLAISEPWFIWFADPGHAWLQVPLADVRASGANISTYSYQDEEFAYLEEDSDARAYLDTLTTIPRFHEHHTDDDSPIRDLKSYK